MRTAKRSRRKSHAMKEKKAMRRRRRLEKRNGAECHWQRRRAGTRNSAPELRNRPSEDFIGADQIVGGSPPDNPVDLHVRRLKRLNKGIQPMSDVERMERMYS